MKVHEAIEQLQKLDPNGLLVAYGHGEWEGFYEIQEIEPGFTWPEDFSPPIPTYVLKTLTEPEAKE